jgi:serine protease Do
MAVTPKSPAAAAKLQAGDVIVSVNQKELKNADQFTDVMGKAYVGEEVQFTVKRPDVANPFEVPVKLGSTLTLDWNFRFADVANAAFGWRRWGMQMVELTDRAALAFGAQNGLVVLAVQPNSAAARSGIRVGDIVESIDGRVMNRRAWSTNFEGQKRHTVSVVRDREKKQIVLEVEE